MSEHGGRLLFHAQHYQRPAAEWLDLSTGINPHSWPVPQLPATVWSRLPEQEDDLLTAAQQYYQTPSLMAVAGSQMAIQLLPLLRDHSRVGVLTPAYAEHADNWQRAGHHVQLVSAEAIEQALPQLDVLIVVHPNNPSGHLFSPQDLLRWRQQLQRRGGWLIVDEAFIDVTPEHSLARFSPMPSLIILRSLGKFFGLAGLRIGFVLAETSILARLQNRLGPWPIATASRYIACQALSDSHWQQHNRERLQQAAQRLQQLLTQYGLPVTGATALFQWIVTPHAEHIHQQLAEQGILTRLFLTPASLRFGLPADEADWQRLQRALAVLRWDN